LRVVINAIGKRLQFANLYRAEAAKLGIEVLFSDASASAPAMVGVGGAVISPLIEHSDYEACWTNLFDRYQIDAAMSIVDTDQIALRRVTSTADRIFLGPENHVLEICQDKFLFAKALEELGVPTVPTKLEPYEGRSISKDRFGSCGSNIAFHCNTDDALSHEAKINSARVYQPQVTGRHIDIDFHYDGANLYHSQKEVIHKENGESFVLQECHEPAISDLVLKLVSQLGYRGVGNADIWGVENEWLVMEVNPRFGGNYPATHLLGYNFIALQLSHCFGLTSIAQKWPVSESRKVVKHYMLEVIQ